MAKSNTVSLIATLVGLAAIIYWIQTAEPPVRTASKEPALTNTANDAIPLPASSGPTIGGAFELTDQNGLPFSSNQLLGKYAIIFFGFTHCPDMCPTAMTTLTAALNTLEPAVREKLIPVFITVDPKRDTPEALKVYLANFDPHFIGLTGSFDQIKQATSAYKVFYETANPADADYNVNHSGYLYFMSPEGKYIQHFSHTASPGEIAAGIKSTVTGNTDFETP